jgi:hypothetical protein
MNDSLLSKFVKVYQLFTVDTVFWQFTTYSDSFTSLFNMTVNVTRIRNAFCAVKACFKEACYRRTHFAAEVCARGRGFCSWAVLVDADRGVETALLSRFFLGGLISSDTSCAKGRGICRLAVWVEDGRTSSGARRFTWSESKASSSAYTSSKIFLRIQKVNMSPDDARLVN